MPRLTEPLFLESAIAPSEAKGLTLDIFKRASLSSIVDDSPAPPPPLPNFYSWCFYKDAKASELEAPTS